MRHLSALRHLIILLAMLCASCGTALPSIKPYKLDVQQGNVVTSKMLLQLRPGMTQSQVRFIMGTPLIQDSFHGKRWDYVYQMREHGKIIEHRRVILDFENEVLKTVRGDVVASGGEAGKSNEVADNSGTRVINPSATSEDKSLFSTLKFWEKKPAAETKSEAKTKPSAPAVVQAVTASETKPAETKPAEPAPLPATAEAAATPEPPSLLAVPLVPGEAAPATVTVPEAATVTPALEVATPAPTETAAPVVEAAAPSAETAPAVAEAAPPVQPNAPAAVLAEPVAIAAPVQVYDSPSGMRFDRSLRMAPEDLAPVPAPKPEVALPRAGNTEVPKAKELPAAPKPSFFDRMLEKIGF